MPDVFDLYATASAASTAFSDCVNIIPETRKYIASRGIKESVAQDWGIGYAPTGDKFASQMASFGYNEDDLQALGLVYRHPDTEKLVFSLTGRVIFPICDVSGQVVGFGGRKFLQNNGTPKYLNTPDSQIYRKCELLYGFHKALETIRQKRRIILVEGYIDVIVMHQAGFTETVGVCGTAFTEFHASLLNLLGCKAYFMFDSDAAGAKGQQKALDISKNFNYNHTQVTLPEGDPAEFISKYGIRQIEELLNARE